MKKISAVLVAAACMFVMTASAFASDAPKAEEKKDAKKEDKKAEEKKPADAAAPAPAPEAPKK